MFSLGNWPKRLDIITKHWLAICQHTTHNILIAFATLTTGIFLFYSIAEKFLDERKSLVATIFLMSIPMLTFLSIIDTKTEIPLLFSGAATILAWLEWREKKEKNTY